MDRVQDEIRVLLIEDEEIWATIIAANLNDFGYTVAGSANTFETAVSLLNSCEYDIVLQDINIQGRNSGIELGKMIRNLYHKPFIFITASFDKHTTQDAIQAGPSAYLTKPVNPTSLLIAIQNALNYFNNQVVASAMPVRDEEKTFFFVKQGNRHKKIDWKDVVYLRSEKNYTCIFNAQDKTEYFIRSTLPKTLSYIIPDILQSNFVQVNRSEVMQLSFITEITGDEVVTRFGNFGVSEAHIKELKKHLRLIS